jgi:hypothetical protein
VFSGTRVTLPTVLSSLAAGDSVEQILAAFPSLKAEDVQAAITFAAASAEEDLPVSGSAYSMRIKLDENLPVTLASALTNLGHDVHTVTGESLTGCGDREIWDRCPRRKAVLCHPGVGLF